MQNAGKNKKKGELLFRLSIEFDKRYFTNYEIYKLLSKDELYENKAKLNACRIAHKFYHTHNGKLQ